MTTEVIKVPPRANPARKIRIVFPRWDGPTEGAFKVALRDKAKAHRLYHTPVDASGVAGRSSTGVPIPVNTLGRWIWGVPGYAGNAVFMGFEDPPAVYLPADAPEEAVRLLEALGGVVAGVKGVEGMGL